MCTGPITQSGDHCSLKYTNQEAVYLQCLLTLTFSFLFQMGGLMYSRLTRTYFVAKDDLDFLIFLPLHFLTAGINSV